jgi:hypothetical protein
VVVEQFKELWWFMARLPGPSGSIFSTKVTYVKKMAVFPIICTFKPASKVFMILAANAMDPATPNGPTPSASDPNPDSSNSSSDNLPAPGNSSPDAPSSTNDPPFSPQSSGLSYLPSQRKVKLMKDHANGLVIYDRLLYTNSGKEYTSKMVKNTFTTFLQDMGFIHDSISIYSSASNGAAEHLNRTLFNMARPCLIKAKLPIPFWAEAINMANNIRNRLPSKSTPIDKPMPGEPPPKMKSSHEAWFGKQPKLSHLCRFGRIAFHRILTEIITKGAKADPCAIKCCLLGYIGNQVYCKVLLGSDNVSRFSQGFKEAKV